MSMIKIASPQDWVGSNDTDMVEVKISSRGWLPGDYRKVALEVGDQFIAAVRQIEDQLDPANNKYAHIISCGATEVTGPNRNADGWGIEALKKSMHTYLKHAKCYRDHRSGKEAKFYGRPKVAFFDTDRGYGRLLGEYFATKEAAHEKYARIADLEIQAMEKGDPFRVSHGSKIDHDTCSICGNNAEKRSKYCDSEENGGKCRLFGCKRGLSKISEDGEVQFVHNDSKNCFYDISSIGLEKFASARQADRIAYANAYDLLSDKTASADDIIHGSAWLAEKLGMEDRNDLLLIDTELTPHEEKMLKIAIDLAEMTPYPGALFDDYDANIEDVRLLASPYKSIKTSVAHAIATKGQVIGPRLFAKAAGCDREMANKVAACTRGIYARLRDAGQLVETIKRSVFTASPLARSVTTTATVSIPQASIQPEVAMERAKVSMIVGEDTQCCCDDVFAAQVALDYAAYKIATAAQLLEQNQKDLRFLA